jgi:hypothetical protein
MLDQRRGCSNARHLAGRRHAHPAQRAFDLFRCAGHRIGPLRIRRRVARQADAQRSDIAFHRL